MFKNGRRSEKKADSGEAFWFWCRVEQHLSLERDLEFAERINIRAAGLQAGPVCVFTLHKQGVKNKSRCVGWRPGGAAPEEMAGQNQDPEAGLCVKTRR